MQALLLLSQNRIQEPGTTLSSSRKVLLSTKICYKKVRERKHLVDPVSNQASWALLADKGYAGAEALLRAITPKKSLPNQRLSAEEVFSNQRLSSARVICENFYGRLKGLFSICAVRYRGIFHILNPR